MRSLEAASPSCRSKKPDLRSSKKPLSTNPLELSTKTPEKIPELTRRRTRNRCIALSFSDVRKVAEGLQQRRNRELDPPSSQPKTARRQILLASPRKPKTYAKPETNADEEEPFKLPEKFEILDKFFDGLNKSIPLLRRRSSTFTNISKMIEDLISRRFTRSHLAQLKFILPEAIAIEKITTFDERTSCMKPDLHVSINPDVIEFDAMLKTERGGVSVNKLFHERLIDFCKSHPEVHEIPEATLPEPFNYRKQDFLSKTFKTPSSSLPRVISSPALVAQKNDTSDNTESSTPATPALAAPLKRQFMSPNVDSSGSPSKLVRRPLFSDDLFQSIREKEIMAMEERDPAISQAKRRQKMIAKLPKLFNMIHLMFQSINRSVITKEELLSKIIMSHWNIVDRKKL